MTEEIYTIMKELVSLHEREKVLQNNLKDILEKDEKHNVVVTTNGNDLLNIIKQEAEKHLDRKENNDGPVFYCEGGYEYEKTSLSTLLSGCESCKEFLDKLHTYGYNYVHDLRYDKDKHIWTEPGTYDFEAIYRNINGYGKKTDWYILYNTLINLVFDNEELLDETFHIINTDFLNIDFNNERVTIYINDMIDEDFCEKYNINALTRNALWRAGYQSLGDLATIDDFGVFKKTKGIGPTGFKAITQIFQKVDLFDY